MKNQPKNMRYYLSCHGYITEMKKEIIKPYPLSEDLIQNPEVLDSIINLERVDNMCYSFLVDNSQIELPIELQSFSQKDQDNMLYNVAPITLCDFFQQEHVMKSYIDKHEYGIQDAFINNNQFKPELMAIVL